MVLTSENKHVRIVSLSVSPHPLWGVRQIQIHVHYMVMLMNLDTNLHKHTQTHTHTHEDTSIHQP